MRISFVGTRGIPARYGGFETFVEEVSVRLAKRGHCVTVYCVDSEPSGTKTMYQGVRLVHLPMNESKPLEYIIKTVNAGVVSTLSKVDIVHYFGCSRVPLALCSRLAGKKVLMTLDGLEWERTSYSRLARMVMRSYAELAMVFPHAAVCDSHSSQEWYRTRTGIEPWYVPYGTHISVDSDDAILKEYGLSRGNYILFAGRLVHEKGVHTLVEAFNKVQTDKRLVVIGDAPRPSPYIDSLKARANDRTVFLGYVYGRDFEVLRNSAMIYVHPSMLDGTSIALLGAMGSGRCIISSNIRENMDVAGDAAEYFPAEDSDVLAAKLMELLDDPSRRDELSSRSIARARQLHDWERITDSYEAIYMKIMSRS